MSSGYVWTGRGGAGNMISKEELRKKEEDLEAQQSKATGSANQLATDQVAAPPSGEYKHMGRGGAGNWFQPSELAAQGATITDTASIAPTPEPATETQRPVSLRPWRGRGGAGNFAPDSEEAQVAEKEELKRNQRQQQLEEADVRASVDSTLSKPSQAHLKTGEKGWDVTGWREAGL
ncbi:hypothetical protein C7212DRAFT_359734 [Tuber magnatum]|uniref:Uncharacterized protein n=1 Tax=Tuber magnatum TaxID=42249 RepID=A0A317SIZ0_9PEZI|nr:hypothetical protein C7212DRAFT_359734 [Tuber magnatum]